MSTRIVLLPGLGADERLFGPQLEVFENATVPLWLPPVEDEELGRYALRFGQSVVEPAPGEDWIAVGFSFGGMVALEMASRLPEDRRPRAVGLLSGIRSLRSVSKWFRLQVRAGAWTPAWLAMPVIAGPVTGLFARACGLDRRWTAELHGMAADLDWEFLVWAARACSRWEFDGRCPVPVRWLHGGRDRVVPYVAHPELGDEVELLEGASHMITWTEAERVNAWIGQMAGTASAR